jgi:hypothetical protein
MKDSAFINPNSSTLFSRCLSHLKMLKIRRARQEDCHSIGRVHIAAVTGISTGVYTPEEIQAWAVPREASSYEELIRSKEFFVASWRFFLNEPKEIRVELSAPWAAASRPS